MWRREERKVLQLRFVGYELKKWSRDSLLAFFIIYPLIFAAAARWLVPIIETRSNITLVPYYYLIVGALALFTPLIFGAVAAFSILEDRDDNILLAIKVAPLSLNFFIGIKLLIVFLLSFLSSVFIIWFSRLASVSASTLIGVSFVAAGAAPLTALLINAVASNKIEGFASVKGLGVLIILPVVALLFFDKKEFLFAFVPGFWPAKALATAMLPNQAFQLSYTAYLVLGLAYVVTLNLATYRLFKAKVS